MEQCFGAPLFSTGYVKVIQKKAVRNICNVVYNAHTGPLFKQLSIPKLNDIYNAQLCKLMFYLPMEHFPVPYRWYLRVIQMCIRTKLDRLMIHILLQGKVSLSRNVLCIRPL